jgi:hypothetical protein
MIPLARRSKTLRLLVGIDGEPGSLAAWTHKWTFRPPSSLPDFCHSFTLQKAPLPAPNRMTERLALGD